MNKEFIPYREALALKELGFNENCICKWEENYLCQDEGFDICNNDTWLTNKKLHVVDSYCTAPLYQQVFKWFRENYNIDNTIQPVANYEGNTIGYFYELISVKGSKIDIESDTFKTYEEAQLQCVKKLIEITKSNG